MALPKYWCTDVTKESVRYVNKKYNQTWNANTTEYKYIGYDGNGNGYRNGTDKWSRIEHFQNNPTYLTPQQFMEAIKTEEFKRGDIVIDDNGAEAEFIADLLEKDKYGFRYILNNKLIGYFFTESVTKKQEPTEIEKAIELLTREGKIKDGKILI